jgi:amidase
MSTHRLDPARFWNVVGGHEPALRVYPGDSVATRTIDGDGFDERGVRIADEPNPLTGPVFVDGADPGDCLSVHIDRLVPSRRRGWSYRFLSPNALEPGALNLAPDTPGDAKYADWDIDIDRRVVTCVDASCRLELPLSPMLGCIGTAPPDGQVISTLTSGTWGGNMDYPGVRPGATVYLPVSARGAMLYLGDGHAAQADGEIGGVGVEVPMGVVVTVNVLKGRHIGWPRGEDAECIFTVGNARPLEDAVRIATTEMARWLSADYTFSPERLALAFGQTARYALASVVSPAYTVVCRMEKRHLGPYAG